MDDEVAEAEGSHGPTEFKKEPGKAVASGWIGSALEYYDFFVYATAASLVFPDSLLFPEPMPIRILRIACAQKSMTQPDLDARGVNV